MLSRYLRSLTFVCLISFLYHNVCFARHHRHRHAVRPSLEPPALTSEIDIPPTTISLPPSLETLVPKDLRDLPKELLMYVIAIEQRLLEIENLLERLLLAAATSGAPTPVEASHSRPKTNVPRPTSSVEMCRSPDTVTEFPCSDLYIAPTTTTTTTRRRTETFTLTETLHPASSTPKAHITIKSSSTCLEISAPYPSLTHTNTTAVYYPTGSASAIPLPQQNRTYHFDSQARNNLAVYYGTTPATQVGGLSNLCSNPNVDIVILSFLFTFFTPHGYPSIDFGPGCIGPNARQQAQAPGLSNCTALAPEIAGCQSLGKKVLVSLGGYASNTSFSSEEQTHEFAATLWSLFGPGKNEDPELRPFGPDVVVDGFDIDNENHNTSLYNAFAHNLRTRYNEDPSKTYYISAAPQCPLPDESIPRGAMLEADFVWVQFYNNPPCNLGSTGFQGSFAAWSRNLTGASSRGNPRIYIGAGAWEGAGTGYVKGSELGGVVMEAKELDLVNLGGMMLWDGSEALENVDEFGVDYLRYAKSAVKV